MNPIYADLFGDPDTTAHFTAEAELAAMIRVEIALSQVQSRLGVIPSAAGPAIAAACAGLRIDPASVAQATAQNGVPVPVLVKAMRAAMAGQEASAHLHWGATSQDIMDSGLALRLRDVLDLWQGRLAKVTAQLGDLALAHADLPMAARTYGQLATPTGFGAVVAGWGWPLLDHACDLDRVRAKCLRVSLAGAAGTLAAMGPQGPAVRAALARELDLADPGHGWHSDRSGMAALAGWVAGLAASLGKIAEDLLLMTQSGIGIVQIAGGGASSTMPQKQNPVGPAALAAMARQVLALAATLTGAGLHRQQRDGAAWFTEWLTLPQMCISTGRMLSLTGDVLARLAPDGAAMARDLDTGHGVIHAEALAFAAVESLGLDRAEAAGVVARLCQQAAATGQGLIDLAVREWPGHDWVALVRAQGLGTAPAEARAFHGRVLSAIKHPDAPVLP